MYPQEYLFRSILIHRHVNVLMYFMEEILCLWLLEKV